MVNSKKRKFSLPEITEKARKYCAYQERCQSEVINKLSTWGVSYTESLEIVMQLISERFIDEERFAEAYVSGKFRFKHWGKNKIRLMLKQKGISDYSINKGLSQISEEEYENVINKLILKKTKQLEGERNPFIKNKKISNYLTQKGYSFTEFSNLLSQ